MMIFAVQLFVLLWWNCLS